MKKQLTESQAWTYLAKLWDKPTISDWDGTFIEKYGAYGICGCLHRMKMSQQMYLSMLDKIPVRGMWGYCWKTTRAGARQRAAFCRRMAKLTAKRKRRTKHAD